MFVVAPPDTQGGDSCTLPLKNLPEICHLLVILTVCLSHISLGHIAAAGG